MRAVRLAARLLSIITAILLAALLAANIYTIIVRCATDETHPTVFGFAAAVVISGSMAEEIGVNDLIITRRADMYETGDVITYKKGGTLITHRIIAVTADGFITQGDANNAPDPQPVLPEETVGRVVLTIPKIGYFIEFIQSPLGMTLLVLIGTAMTMVPAWLSPRETGGSK